MVTENDIHGRLRDDARDFEFVQWIRLWLREKARDSDAAGLGVLDRLEDGLAIHHSGSLGFAPQDIHSFRESDTGREELLVHFLGLQGASSPLPSFLVDPLQRSEENWAPLKAFYRLFEDRIFCILAQGLVLRSPAIRSELGNGDSLQAHLDLWTGSVDAARRSTYIGGIRQLVPHGRGRKGMERFLSRQLGIERVAVDDSCPARVPNPSPAGLDGESRLDGSCAPGSHLPVGGGGLRITLGPVEWEVFRRWSREPTAMRRRLAELVEAFLPRPMQWEAVAVLDPAGVPADCGRILGDGDPETQPRLGMAAWLGSESPEPAMLALDDPQEKRPPPGSPEAA